jgi:hypothetical protein
MHICWRFVPNCVNMMPTFLGLDQQVSVGGCCSNWFMCPSILAMWINLNHLTPQKVIQWKYEFIPRSPTMSCLVNDILYLGCQLCIIHYDDSPHLVVINKVGLSQATLLTFLSFLCFQTFRNGGTRRVWDFNYVIWRSPMWMKRNEPWSFTLTLWRCFFYKGAHRWILF